MPGAAPASALVCVAVDARFLQAGDVAGLRAEAVRAAADGADVLFVGRGILGDPFVLAAGLSLSVPRALVGVRLGLSEDGRHPAMLAREVTSLDLVCGGRSVLCFEAPFDERLAEAISLCRTMWREGQADSAGPHFPVHAAVNRPRPAGDGSPLVALDLTGGDEPPAILTRAADLLVRPTNDPAMGRVERA
jgi:alkanesulfonate monooxygenase SsuD/methylene tetrahydromethanopterin reductase-like flavin-dependent oxidoreductase (luciferase family)